MLQDNLIFQDLIPFIPQQGESRLLRKLLEYRFGTLPTWASDKINSAAEQDLESWGEAVLTAPSLDAVFDNGATH